MKRVVFAVAIAGCSSPSEPPSPEPPAAWGVPISGGNMIVTSGGTHAVIADADRDRLMVVDLDRESATEHALAAGSEPGRLVEDGDGRVHIALRGTGELATYVDGEVSTRMACGDPRGVAWDAATDLVHVACATGELVSLPAAGGDAVRTLRLERDLRDVIVQGDRLVVTRLRTAEVLTVDAAGTVLSRVAPPLVTRTSLVEQEDGTTMPVTVEAPAAVAWRTVALPDGRLVMAHQRARSGNLSTKVGGYQAQCGQGLVESAVSVVTSTGVTDVAPFVRGALPVDIAFDAANDKLAFVAAGAQSVFVASITALESRDDEKCGDTFGVVGVERKFDELGAPTSVAYRPSGALVIYYPELPALVVHELSLARTIRLPGALGYDSGRAMFHRQTGAGFACASCHPEGREDGRVWQFAELGPRRTQSLAGGVLARAPFHWGGDMADIPSLMDAVFSQRMGGGAPTRSERISLGRWLDRVPAPAPVTVADAAAVARGQTLFMSEQLGCINCHAGPAYTNNARYEVGTGGLFKVPSLVGVGARAPFLHNGCAPTLRDRFGTCGGGDRHGLTSPLSEAQLADLVAYLETL